LALHQKLGLSARLSQRLILTPSLQQAIKLLPLTTLELDPDRTARAAVDLLLDIIEARADRHSQIEIPSRLVVRDSS